MQVCVIGEMITSGNRRVRDESGSVAKNNNKIIIKKFRTILIESRERKNPWGFKRKSTEKKRKWKLPGWRADDS